MASGTSTSCSAVARTHSTTGTRVVGHAAPTPLGEIRLAGRAIHTWSGRGTGGLSWGCDRWSCPGASAVCGWGFGDAGVGSGLNSVGRLLSRPVVDGVVADPVDLVHSIVAVDIDVLELVVTDVHGTIDHRVSVGSPDIDVPVNNRGSTVWTVVGGARSPAVRGGIYAVAVIVEDPIPQQHVGRDPRAVA